MRPADRPGAVRGAGPVRGAAPGGLGERFGAESPWPESQEGSWRRPGDLWATVAPAAGLHRGAVAVYRIQPRRSSSVTLQSRGWM